MNGKGSHRRPEDREAIERNWPFKPSPWLKCGCVRGQCLCPIDCNAPAGDPEVVKRHLRAIEGHLRPVTTPEFWSKMPEK